MWKQLQPCIIRADFILHWLYSGTLPKEHLIIKDTANQDIWTSPNLVYFPPPSPMRAIILVPRVSILERFHCIMLKREAVSLITVAVVLTWAIHTSILKMSTVVLANGRMYTVNKSWFCSIASDIIKKYSSSSLTKERIVKDVCPWYRWK